MLPQRHWKDKLSRTYKCVLLTTAVWRSGIPLLMQLVSSEVFTLHLFPDQPRAEARIPPLCVIQGPMGGWWSVRGPQPKCSAALGSTIVPKPLETDV